MTFGPRPQHRWLWKIEIVRWVDADTFVGRWDHGGRIYSVAPFRLAGIDAPEIHGVPIEEKNRGANATLRAISLAPIGSVVIAETSKPDPGDKYGRWVAVIWPANGANPRDDRSVNQILVDEGHAVLKDYR